MLRSFLFSVLVCVLLPPCSEGLQCYKCDNNDNNWKDCTDTNLVQTCSNFQDACVTYTSFFRFIDYHPRSEMWHNISKGCDSLEACQRRAVGVNDDMCRRSSYKEWACVECCTGDLCNYFVTLGSSRLYSSTSLLLFLILLAFLSTTTSSISHSL